MCVFFIEEKVCLKCKFINYHCVIDFLVKLMLNSSKYFKKHAQIWDSFVVKFSSHWLKILVELKRAHYAGIRKLIFIWVQKHLGFQIKFSKTNFCVYDLFCSSVFIHNSRSENVRKTTASAVVTKIRNDLQWPTMIYNDLQWPQWSTMTYKDLQWPTMIYNDLQWATMTERVIPVMS